MDEKSGQEALKLYFDFFKHFTTLTTATTVIVFAFGTELGATKLAPSTGLYFLVFTLGLSLLGMLLILNQIVGMTVMVEPLKPHPVLRKLKGEHMPAYDDRTPFRAPGLLIVFVAVNTIISFLVGVIMFAISAL